MQNEDEKILPETLYWFAREAEGLISAAEERQKIGNTQTAIEYQKLAQQRLVFILKAMKSMRD